MKVSVDRGGVGPKALEVPGGQEDPFGCLVFGVWSRRRFRARRTGRLSSEEGRGAQQKEKGWSATRDGTRERTQNQTSFFPRDERLLLLFAVQQQLACMYRSLPGLDVCTNTVRSKDTSTLPTGSFTG